MADVKPHLRLVRVKQRPLANLSRAEKLANAIAYLRSRNRYILDGATKPDWGIPYAQPEESPLMKAVMEADRRRK